MKVGVKKLARNTKIRINYGDIKEVNRRMTVWNKQKEKPEIFINIQNEIKNLPKSMRKYNRKSKMYELKKDRNMSEKNLQLLKETVNSTKDTLPNLKEVILLKKQVNNNKKANYSINTLVNTINNVKSNYNNKIGTDIIGAYWLTRRKYPDIDDNLLSEKMIEMLNYYDEEEKHFDMDLLNHDLFEVDIWQDM